VDGSSGASGIARRRELARAEGGAAYVQRRRELVAAAARVFKAKGLQGASLGDIAAEAGADRASLYYYVAGKDELFHEAVREAAEGNLVAARALRDGPGTAPDKIRALVTQLMASYEEHYPVLYVLIQENLAHAAGDDVAWASDMRAVNREYEQIVIELVQTGYDEGSLRDIGPAWVVAYGVLGMLGWTNRWFSPSTSPLPAPEIGAAFADVLLGGLRLP
jgi:AcrR family transcriptional regulator